MSQAKVDKHKEEKRQRKEDAKNGRVVKSGKGKKVGIGILVVVIVALFIAWVGYNAHQDKLQREAYAEYNQQLMEALQQAAEEAASADDTSAVEE